MQIEELTPGVIRAQMRTRGIEDESLISAMIGYLTEGYDPGGFVTAVLENDLVRTFQSMSPDSTSSLEALVKFVNLDLPGPTRGSIKQIVAWQTHVRDLRDRIRRGPEVP